MIPLTRLGGRPFYLNCDLIETLESVPDTTIHLTNGKVVLVEEAVPEVVARMIAFRREIFFRPSRRLSSEVATKAIHRTGKVPAGRHRETHA